MGDKVRAMLVKPIQLTDQVVKAANEVRGFEQECSELISMTEQLADHLRQAARASSDLYERAAIRIIEDTEQALEKALAWVQKCKGNVIMKRVFNIIPTAAFRKIYVQLENSSGNVSWLLRVSIASEDGDNHYLGLPAIASTDPMLGFIWQQIALLSTGTMEERSDAAGQLVSVCDSDRKRKMIIEEGGIQPLLKLVKEGHTEGQEKAAKAIGLLGRDPDSVEQMMIAGVCSVFAKILKEGAMSVQAEVAWAVSELASNHPKCQDHFAHNGIVRLLVGHLAFETIPEHSKYAIATQKVTSVHAVVNAAAASSNGKEKGHARTGEDHDHNTYPPHPMGNLGNRFPMHLHNVVANTMASNLPLARAADGSSSQSVHSRGRESAGPETKAKMKAMAALALWKLAKGNPDICRSITESRGLLCFAVLLEKGPSEVQIYSAKALMDITAVAETDDGLRRSAFKPNSTACQNVVHQLLRIIEMEIPNLLLYCVKAIGNLARTFRATETRMILPLVKLLDDRERDPAITGEAAIALSKFASPENYLHRDHSNAILNAGGAMHLVQLVYFVDKPTVKLPAIRLLCYISCHVPDSEELGKAGVLGVLDGASKQSVIIHDQSLYGLLDDAISKLELYQSRVSRGIFPAPFKVA